METILPDCAERDLNKRIDERSKLAFCATFSLRDVVARSCEYNGPEVDTMYKLPVIHLLVRLLNSPSVASL